MSSKKTTRVAAALLAAAAFCLGPALPRAEAGVEVSFDSRTLNDVLSSITIDEVEVPITESRSVTVRVENLKVLGFEPGSDTGSKGFILTSLELTVPKLGLSFEVQPRLALDVIQQDAGSILELRFDRVELPLPFGNVNIAGFLDPMRFPADSIFLLNGAQGDVEVRSRLSDIHMGKQIVRFELTLDVQPPDPSTR